MALTSKRLRRAALVFIQMVLVVFAVLMIAVIILAVSNIIGPIATIGVLLFLWAMVFATIAYFDERND